MSVKNYRKKPVTVQGIRFNNSQDLSNVSEVLEFTGHYFRVRDIVDVGNSVITAEVYDYLHDTWVGVKDGDVILRGVQGELYPHDGTLFEKVYDEH